MILFIIYFNQKKCIYLIIIFPDHPPTSDPEQAPVQALLAPVPNSSIPTRSLVHTSTNRRTKKCRKNMYQYPRMCNCTENLKIKILKKYQSHEYLRDHGITEIEK